jgi:hypothetical protein
MYTRHYDSLDIPKKALVIAFNNVGAVFASKLFKKTSNKFFAFIHDADQNKNNTEP